MTDLDRGAEQLDLRVQSVGSDDIRTGDDCFGDQLLHLDQRVSGPGGPAQVDVRSYGVGDGGQLTLCVSTAGLMGGIDVGVIWYPGVVHRDPAKLVRPLAPSMPCVPRLG